MPLLADVSTRLQHSHGDRGFDDYSRQRINTISKAAREIQELVDAFLTLARGKGTEQAA